MFNQLLLLCRPGFEKECAGEIMEWANQFQFPAYVQTNEQSGVVRLVSSSNLSTKTLITKIDFRQLIFTRQWFASSKDVLELPETNRLSDILTTIEYLTLKGSESFCKRKNDSDLGRKINFCEVTLDYADTNEGKSLSKFCKQFKPHLLTALKNKSLLSSDAPWRLHLFFTDSLHVTIGISPINNSASETMGIIRLKMPGKAPSRSTLKMEEAIHWFFHSEQRIEFIKNGMTVVDLGAAPGGWTWQFVQRDCLVTAIDNGPMDNALMKSGMVEHLQTDAFTYAPTKKVDWLICDMAERPLHVSRLIARWFTEKQCSNAIFNLKLPMKKRLASVHECIDLLDEKLTEANIDYTLHAKHLYHDREEITVCILRS